MRKSARPRGFYTRFYAGVYSLMPLVASVYQNIKVFCAVFYRLPGYIACKAKIDDRYIAVLDIESACIIVGLAVI